MMRRGGGLGFVAAALLLVGLGIAVWGWRGGTAETPTTASFGFEDWLVRCQAVEGNVGCGMSQQILDKGSGQSVLQLHMARAPSGTGYQLAIVLPLGVTVAGGTAIQVGDLKRNAAFTQCLPGGCIAPIAADAALIEKFKSTPDGHVGVIDRFGKPVSIPFSLKGFGPAFEKMESQGGMGTSGATWWTDFWNRTGTK